MTLLKGTSQTKTPKRPSGSPVVVSRWPEDSDGLGLTFRDGWNFGIGFGLALVIAVPIILGVIGCLLYLAIVILGVSLGGL